MASNELPGTRKRGRLRKDADPPNKRPRLASPSTASKKTPRASSSTTFTKSHGTPTKRKTPVDETHEVPDSDEEREKTPTKRALGRPRSTAKKSPAEIERVYDFHSSDEEEPVPAQTPSRRATRGAALTSAKHSTAREARSLAAAENGTNTGSKTPAQGPGSGKRSTASGTRGKKAGHNDGKAAAPEDEDSAEEEEEEEAAVREDILNTPSAFRTTTKRGTPLSAVKNGLISTLKGILTPSRRLSERNAKSVAFDEPTTNKTDHGEMFFADLPNKPVKSRQPKSAPTRPTGKENKPVEQDAANDSDEASEAGEEEDEVCAICSKPDSKPPNQILFCDSCDMAVHQKCYGVLRIPKGDWLCKNCAQKSSTGAVRAKDSVPVSEAVPNIPNFEQHLRSLQRVLLDRCTGKRRIKLCGQDEAYEKTYQLVEQTVTAGEGNSMLIIGARGCGKTTMLDSVLADVGQEHRSEFHVVRLNGFIHTDDKLALKDIWRQLGKEMDVEDDLIGKTNNYADTLASLLALLSHPSEIADAQAGATSQSVVFVIDEFDLFATHARQTLLYNLFDIAQARKAPIAVLGLTTRVDVVESLEKRVKSRFSHRYAYMSLPRTLREFWEICRQGLLVDDEDAKAEGLDISLKGHAQFHEYWSDKIDALYKDQAFKDHLDYHYYSSKLAPAFLTSCVLPLVNLSPSNLTLQLSPAQGTVLSTDPPDSKLHLLEALSDLDLALLISAARLDIVAHTDTVNFAMAYDEYTTLIGRQRIQSSTSGMLALGGGVRVWGRGVAEMAWERLAKLALLLPTGMGSKHGGLEGRMWKVDVTLEEIPVAVKLSTVLARWCKEI